MDEQGNLDDCMEVCDVPSGFCEIFGNRMQDDGFRGKPEESHDPHEILWKFVISFRFL